MSSENESVSPPLGIEKCSLVLVDVAGTTTSINFVKDTLLPYVTEHVEAFLKGKWDDEPIKKCIELIKEEGSDLDLASATEKIKTLTSEGSSNQGLKTLQGLIYEEGYGKGDLKAHIFDDVSESFESWSKNRQVAVYSTGSTDAQKLLFSHTVNGDISSHIHKYFDQTVGSKTEADSYKAIAKDVEVAPEEIVFITDDVKEATAAKSGGFTAVLIKREGNAELPEGVDKEFMVISSFKDLGLDKVAKRKIEEEAATEEAPPSKIPKTESTEVTKPSEEKVKEKEEPMEVDPPAKTIEGEKSEETEKLAETKSSEETEKSSEKESEKTETEIKGDGDAEMETTAEEKKEENAQKKQAQETETKTEVVEKQKEVAKEDSPATTEEKPNKIESVTEKVEEMQTDEGKVVETKEEEAKAVESTEETEGTKVEETKVTEDTKKDETKVTLETKSVEELVAEEPLAVETSKEESEVVEESATVAEPNTSQDKPEEKEEEKPVENGEEKTTEEAESSNKVEEKENKSVLANGVENGKDESEVDNTPADSAEVKLDDDKTDESDVKVKKLEESAESKTVSVEV